MVQNTGEGNSIVEVEDCNARKAKRRSHPKAKMKSLRSFSQEDDNFRESKHSQVFDVIERNIEDAQSLEYDIEDSESQVYYEEISSKQFKVGPLDSQLTY